MDTDSVSKITSGSQNRTIDNKTLTVAPVITELDILYWYLNNCTIYDAAEVFQTPDRCRS